jgi:hypothetical protein
LLVGARQGRVLRISGHARIIFLLHKQTAGVLPRH